MSCLVVVNRTIYQQNMCVWFEVKGSMGPFTLAVSSVSRWDLRCFHLHSVTHTVNRVLLCWSDPWSDWTSPNPDGSGNKPKAVNLVNATCLRACHELRLCAEKWMLHVNNVTFNNCLGQKIKFSSSFGSSQQHYNSFVYVYVLIKTKYCIWTPLLCSQAATCATDSHTAQHYFTHKYNTVVELNGDHIKADRIGCSQFSMFPKWEREQMAADFRVIWVKFQLLLPEGKRRQNIAEFRE